MAELGTTTNQIYNLNKLLKTFFNYAIQESFIMKNPCFKLSIPKTQETKESRVDPFTDEEIAAILEAATGNIRMLFQLGLGTGLRRGELLGLQCKHVDLDAMTLDVKQALKRVKVFRNETDYHYDVIIKDTKTPNSIREVSIPTGLRPALRWYILSQKEKHARRGVPYMLLFSTQTGSAVGGKNVDTAFKRLLCRAGVRYRCFHNIPPHIRNKAI